MTWALPMDDFLKEYPTLMKANPRHERGNPMVLIYEQHCIKFAKQLHGQEKLDEILEKEKTKKVQSETDNKIIKENHLMNLAMLAAGNQNVKEAVNDVKNDDKNGLNTDENTDSRSVKKPAKRSTVKKCKTRTISILEG